MTPEERDQFIQDVAAAIRTNAPVLSDDELRWVRLAIQKEAQTIKFRQAIIEKSVAALVKTAITALFIGAAGWFAAHIYKP